MNAWRFLILGAVTCGAVLPTSGCWLFKSEEQRAEERAAYRASMDAKVKAWVGRTTAELLKEEGPPDVVLDDPSGAKIWSYKTTWSTVVPGSISVSKSGENSYTASQAEGRIDSTSRSRLFWIDKAGRITKADWYEK